MAARKRHVAIKENKFQSDRSSGKLVKEARQTRITNRKQVSPQPYPQLTSVSALTTVGACQPHVSSPFSAFPEGILPPFPDQNCKFVMAFGNRHVYSRTEQSTAVKGRIL